MCCLAPALGAINRYEMREKYNITGLHKSETAGAKKYFDENKNSEVFGKKDGHGLISVFFPLLRSQLMALGFDYLVLLWCLCTLSGKEGD